ncbi:MAG: cupredoxin domain-containing protein [Patescibacteria group bacterium]|nr:cupredoxin domain-containing protein [Patescibacteria group bacterium]
MMQRIIAAFSSIAMIASLFMPMSAKALTFNPGTLIKGQSYSAVYYFAEDGKRYVFPNEKTYFTWYENFDNIVIVDDRTLGVIPIGGNVTYRPGKKMVKITTDPTVYAIDVGGVLRAIGSEELAQTLYNINWNQQIDDLPDAFFINYKMGSPIATAAEFKPADVMNSVSSISENKGFTSTEAAISIGDTMTGFVPSSITVKVGTTVTWTNQDSKPHTVKGDGFQSPNLEYRESFNRTFNQVGSYQFYDTYNESMVGNISVIN